MKHRSELLQVYSNFAKIVETQFSKHIKIFRFDNALEYTQYAFQNGRAERKLHHILNIVRALLLSAKVPAPFWGEVALHVVHAINRIPSHVIQNQTLYARLFGSPPDYHHLRSFNSACFVLL